MHKPVESQAKPSTTTSTDKNAGGIDTQASRNKIDRGIHHYNYNFAYLYIYGRGNKSAGVKTTTTTR